VAEQVQHAAGRAFVAPVGQQQAALALKGHRQACTGQRGHDGRPALQRVQPQAEHVLVGALQLGGGAEHARRRPGGGTGRVARQRGLHQRRRRVEQRDRVAALQQFKRQQPTQQASSGNGDP
jgi:hypothetical protein